MHLKVHSSTIYDSQDMEAICMSISRWMDREDVVRVYSGILLSHKKEWHFAICSIMDGLVGHCYKWNRSDGGRQTLYDIVTCGI